MEEASGKGQDARTGGRRPLSGLDGRATWRRRDGARVEDGELGYVLGGELPWGGVYGSAG